MIYVALVTALGLIETLLKNAGVKARDLALAESLSAEVKALADTPAGKIAAIALHRDQTGAGLVEAKDAVEKYLATRAG
jgi:ribosomal protein L7/L12